LASRSPSVTIIGAGFGGIGTAVRLAQAGIDDVTILERAARSAGCGRPIAIPARPVTSRRPCTPSRSPRRPTGPAATRRSRRSAPFPAALDDAVAAWRHLVADGADPAATALAGDSADGWLVLSAALRLRADGDPLPAVLGLISPWLDLTGASWPAGRTDPMLRPAGRTDPMLRPA
jgi:glycine/D-amino acid oxidase-like deaminating enzyme